MLLLPEVPLLPLPTSVPAWLSLILILHRTVPVAESHSLHTSFSHSGPSFLSPSLYSNIRVIYFPRPQTPGMLAFVLSTFPGTVVSHKCAVLPCFSRAIFGSLVVIGRKRSFLNYMFLNSGTCHKQFLNPLSPQRLFFSPSVTPSLISS